MSYKYRTVRVRGTELVGTIAWFFFIVNLVKVPFSVWLGLIRWDTLTLNLMLVPAVFAGVAIVLIALGTAGWHPLEWIGAGMTAYGALYFIAHDGLVHHRWPLRLVPRRGYLKRLYQAHLMHHAVQGRQGCVSFGFLYAPPIDRLRAQLRARHGGPLRASSEAAPTAQGRVLGNDAGGN